MAMSGDGVGVVFAGFTQLLCELMCTVYTTGICHSAYNLILLAVSQLSTRIISFLLNLVIARHLSPEAYGVRPC